MFFLAVPAMVVAQQQQGQWSALNEIKSGRGVEVIESNMKRHSGEFVTVTDESVTIREGGSDLSIKRENVVRVSTSSGSKRGQHALVGLVVGGVVGAAVGAASGSSTGFLGGSSRGLTALVGTAIGIPIGATVGAVIPAHRTVYRAAPVSETGSIRIPNPTVVSRQPTPTSVGDNASDSARKTVQTGADD